MKIAHLLPARNKERHIRATATSVLRQLDPGIEFEILLSDQGSTDDTLGILQELAQSYNGPAKLRVLQCPDVDHFGISGLNAHFDWLHTQTDADLILSTSADDLTHPEWTRVVANAFQAYDPSVVGVAIQFLEPGDIPYWEHPVGTTVNLHRTAHPEATRFVTSAECVRLKIGGSCAQAWRHDLHDRHAPLGHMITDMALAFFGGLDRGFFFIHEPHYAYIRHADPNNTGLEGARRHAKTDAERAAYDELIAYEITSTLAHMGAKADQNSPGWEEAHGALMEEFFKFSQGWVASRDRLSRMRVTPMALRA